ncbi:MAG: HAD hydrolase-like protein [Candidatus Glassbacteria bacterium]|nr:HAD hydrolase-like protein [Candidatus Glassbacteria bacterium]
MTENGKPVLALDFDGVLSDSLLEAYLLTWNLAGRVDASLERQLDEAPAIDTIYEFRESHRDHYNAVERIVPLSNRSEDYLVIQKAVEEGRSFSTQQEFDSFKQSVDRELQDLFHEEFYLLRYDLAENHREQWLALNAPYPGIESAVERLAENFRLSVATSKDRETVIDLLRAWGLFDHFTEDFVLDKCAGASKRAHLTVLREKFGCEFGRMTFIDDKVSHLIDCSGLGVRLLLAGWGYNGPREHELAAGKGFEILELQQLGSLSA